MTRLLRVVRALLLVALLVAAGSVATGRLRLETVLTGSMAPQYPVGTLVAVTPLPAELVAVGEVVMFVPPAPWGAADGHPVLHRVVAVQRRSDGHVELRTKGDANAAPDPWTVDASAGGLMQLRASSVVAGRAVVVARHTGSWPAVLVWPGLLLLWAARRVPQREAYRPRHAV